MTGHQIPAEYGVLFGEHGINVLNVAGPRATSQPGIRQFVISVLAQSTTL